MSYEVENYTVEKTNDLRISYSRPAKDYFYIITYLLFASFIFTLLWKFLHSRHMESLGEKDLFSRIIMWFFLGFWCLFGVYFFIVSLEYLIKTVGTVFLIDKASGEFIVRKNLFRKYRFAIADIESIESKGRNLVYTESFSTSNIRRQIFIIEMRLLLKDGQTILIHRFERPNLFTNTKTKSLQNTSRQIGDAICRELGVKYHWKGVRNE